MQPRWNSRTLDMSKGDTRNMYRGADGRLYVRPGMRRIYDPGALSSQAIIAARTIKHPRTEVAWHYFVIQPGIDAGLIVRIVDEDLTTTVQEFQIGVTEARAVTFAVSNDQVLIGSPDFPTVWGWIGGPVTFARKKLSINPRATTLEMPRGLGVAWASRYLVADGNLLRYSDALEPRSFVAQNTLRGEWGSAIYGLHVSAEGMLIVVAESGVYALPESDAAGGQIVLGDWSKLTNYRGMTHNVTCESRGEIWGLTVNGVRRLYPEGEEISLWELAGHRNADVGGFFPYTEVAHLDFRYGRIIPFSGGVLAVLDKHQGSLFHVVDLAKGFRSWWNSPQAADVQFNQRKLVDVITDQRGDDLYCFQEGVFRLRGNSDADDSLTAEAVTQPTGHMVLHYNAGPAGNNVLRKVRFQTDSPDDKKVAINGDLRTAEIHTPSPIVGTDDWDKSGLDDGVIVGVSIDTFQPQKVEMAATDNNTKAREHTVEVSVVGAFSRFEAEVEVKEIQQDRRVK